LPRKFFLLEDASKPIDLNEFNEQIDSKGFVLLSMLSKQDVLEQHKGKRHGNQSVRLAP
jgi:hypothetical protein